MLKNNRIFAVMIAASVQIFSISSASADDTDAIDRISDNIQGFALAKAKQAETINAKMPDEMTPQRDVVEIYRGIIDDDLRNNNEEIVKAALTAYCRKSANPSLACIFRQSPWMRLMIK